MLSSYCTMPKTCDMLWDISVLSTSVSGWCAEFLLFMLIWGITGGHESWNSPFTFPLWERTDGWGCVFFYSRIWFQLCLFFFLSRYKLDVCLFICLPSPSLLLDTFTMMWLAVFFIWWQFLVTTGLSGSIAECFKLCRNLHAVFEMTWLRLIFSNNFSIFGRKPHNVCI